MPDVPLIDLTGWDVDPSERAALAVEVDTALRANGFLLVAGHGVEPAVAADLRAATAAFFALPEETKAAYGVDVLAHGWVPYGREANAYSSGEETPPDMKESFTFGADVVPDGMPAELHELYGPNQWPSEVPDLRAAGTRWIEEVHRVRATLLRLFAAALGLPVDWFAGVTRHPVWQVNVNWYPPVSAIGAAADGQFRIGPHTDFGMLTVLDRQPGMGGLQVQRRDGSWVDAPWEPGALTVNLGDLMARWTGDRWRSARHRVLPPPTATDESLTSLICFFEGDADALVEAMPEPARGDVAHDPVRAGDHLLAKLNQIAM